MKNIKKVGNVGEDIAKIQLSIYGVEMIESVATPVILTPYFDQIRKTVVPGVYYVKWGEKVSGDIRGILPGGRSVHCEVKIRDADRLRFSDLEKHQSEWLTDHDKFGGVSVLIWIRFDEIFTLRWPVEGFTAGTSLHFENARALAVLFSVY